MARKTLSEKLKEQKAAVAQLEQELTTLKDKLITSPGPLMLSMATNRLTGRFALATTVDQANPEPDVRLLLEVVRQVERELSEELVRLTERRIRSELKQETDTASIEPDGEKLN